MLNLNETSPFDYTIVDESDPKTWKDVWGNSVYTGAPVYAVRKSKIVGMIVARDPWKKMTADKKLRLLHPKSFLTEVVNVSDKLKNIYDSNKPKFYQFNREVLKRGCDNPNCQFHRNGWKIIDIYPELSELDTEKQIEIAIRSFEWNHTDRDVKSWTVSELKKKVLKAKDPIIQERWWKELGKEIRKCDLLCVLCHRMETNIQGHHSYRTNHKINNYDDYCLVKGIPNDSHLQRWKTLTQLQ